MGSRIDDVTGGSAGIEERMTVRYSGDLGRSLFLTILDVASSGLVSTVLFTVNAAIGSGLSQLDDEFEERFG